MPADDSRAAALPGAVETLAFARGEHRDPAALTQFKRALGQSLPPLAAAEAYHRQLGLPDSSGFAWQPVAGLRDVAAAEAAVFHEIAPAGEPFVAPPPRVIGGGNHRPLAGIARAFYVTCLADARVCGRSAVIAYGGRVLVDGEAHERAGVDDRLDCDPAVVAATAEAVLLLDATGESGVEIEDAFWLLGPHSWRFGAWLFDHLAKYVAATTARALPPVPVLIDAGLPPRHRQALAAMLRPATGIIELPPLQVARVRRLWCAPSLAYAPISPQCGDDFAWELLAAAPARLAPIGREIARRAAPFESAQEDGRPLFLAGNPAATQNLVNLPALAANAAARGFRVVDPEPLDFAAQVGLVRGAEIIAGATPAALELACFARPQTKLCLLHPADTAYLPLWNALVAGAGVEVTVLSGPYSDPAPGGAWRIDAAALFGVLEAWREADAAAISSGSDLQEPQPPAFAAPRREERPLVSVLCVAYRHERYVRDAVRSILAQTYAPLDIVILDDASPDATAEAIEAELAAHVPRHDIRFIRNPHNLGIIGNVRKGVSLARGDFIVEFASDDVMLPHMVERMVQAWREANVSLVTANAAYIDEDGRSLNRFYTDPQAPWDDSFEALARKGFNAVCFGAAMAFERQLYLEFGYPPEYLTTDDIMLPFYAYLDKGARYTPEPLLQYRLHANNDSLGLRRERSVGTDKLLIEAEMYSIHLAHSVEMFDELERRRAADPTRFEEMAGRIQPLLAQQMHDWAVKLSATRAELHKVGVSRLIQPRFSAGAAHGTAGAHPT